MTDLVGNTEEPLVKVSVRGNTGLLELNRPRALNSLNVEMVTIIDHALKQWKEDSNIKQVVLSSLSPKGFCAGGDVRFAREGALANEHDHVDDFFAQEYILNGDIAEYPKPYISLIDGVVMGGGLGISAHGSHRIVTEKAFGAMPEMAIGFIPDVGVPYMFENMVARNGRSSHALAVFLVVTGWRLSPADMLFSGLATHYVPSENLDQLREKIIEDSLDAALAEFAQEPSEPSQLEALYPDIEAVFGFDSWKSIAHALKEHPNEEFCNVVEQHIAHANPASIVAAVELMAVVARCEDIRQELECERVLGMHFRRDPNFAEGVRAVLVDKDRTPHFHPDNVEDVDVSVYRALLTTALDQ
ncbi:enoyl-CoA hydratase/isomerase family protein [Corynebacterium sp. sy017]|uniref:enoyl-CoA hydratase/isomerase family protein n=1 Tax=Corynebacterium sp. sy017 TaxID=2499527 RepID=UPI001184EED9|nr:MULTISPECIES: enoyl-CoA hydratase/isomerase family protein [unclassified Corynebacterium]MBP3088875.1 enoyl-CoA hydratase/isomerase family protein [Corynebacterium sp. sy017]TSD91215.1 enoyl-CoA hydratase/isomerase family protein [Corynebacterium sp. SY003]